jgi:hypothetical protein
MEPRRIEQPGWFAFGANSRHDFGFEWSGRVDDELAARQPDDRNIPPDLQPEQPQRKAHQPEVLRDLLHAVA